MNGGFGGANYETELGSFHNLDLSISKILLSKSGIFAIGFGAKADDLADEGRLGLVLNLRVGGDNTLR